MSKQIYIDSNGNEVQVSGTVNTADMMPMSGNDSTKVSEAIGDLSQLTTTVKSSLVGAVNEIARYTPVYGNTASGAIATFDTSLALPLQDCTIAINAVQEGTGTPSPDNVRPITGFTGANIHVADNETPHIIDNVTSITWQSEAGTVYGGLLDVTTGLLTVTHKGYIFTGSSDENWSVNLTQTDNYYYRINVPELLKANTAIANMYPYAPIGTNNTVQGINSAVAGTGGQFRIRYGTELSISDWKTFLSNNNLIAIAELVTPQTYQLTQTQISAIVGTNNVFTDTNGDTSVVYACSLKDYIDRQ